MHSTLPEWALLASGSRCNFLANGNASIGIGAVFIDCIKFNQIIAIACINGSVYSESESQ
jgi:hypothetical protein